MVCAQPLKSETNVYWIAMHEIYMADYERPSGVLEVCVAMVPICLPACICFKTVQCAGLA